MVRYRLPEPGALGTPVRFDHFLIVYHRASGQTHMLAEPVPEILEALAEGPGDAATISHRLATRFDGVEVDQVAAHLAELAELGLVDAA